MEGVGEERRERNGWRREIEEKRERKVSGACLQHVTQSNAVVKPIDLQEFEVLG